MRPQRRSPSTPRRVPSARRALSEDAQDAYVHLLGDDLNTDGLAKRMSVSRAKAFRLVTELRQSGHQVAVRKTGRTWHYEFVEDRASLWKDDPTLKLIGFIRNSPVLKPGETVDDVLYGPLKKKR